MSDSPDCNPGEESGQFDVCNPVARPTVIGYNPYTLLKRFPIDGVNPECCASIERDPYYLPTYTVFCDIVTRFRGMYPVMANGSDARNVYAVSRKFVDNWETAIFDKSEPCKFLESRVNPDMTKSLMDVVNKSRDSKIVAMGHLLYRYYYTIEYGDVAKLF